MFIAAAAELVSIGMIYPFLTILIPKESFSSPHLFNELMNYFAFIKEESKAHVITALFCLVTLVAGIIKWILLWANTRISYDIGSELSEKIYRRTLYQPYLVHVSRNSSEIISGISNKTATITYVINAALTFISSLGMLMIITGALIFSNPYLVLTITSGFGLIYMLIIFFVSSKLVTNSIDISQESNNVLKVLQEGLGGIRDILLDETQEIFCKIFKNSEFKLRKALAQNLIISASPRLIMEALGMILIAVLAYYLVFIGDSLGVIPLLGLFALAAQRLLPVLQQMYAAWGGIKGNHSSVNDALLLLEQELPSYLSANQQTTKLVFSKNIHIFNVGFKYSPELDWNFKGVDCVINKGERIGFIGKTGIGKSTLLDIVMGLLLPQEGHIAIDGVVINEKNSHLWRKQVAHVPQMIFLSDSTIAENIAFGVPKKQVDLDRVKHVARLVNISETIESWPLAYGTPVGERGIRLSGGQRQRIAIARALYKNSRVIIFDEATSALDAKMEDDVMNEIYNLGKDLTLLIIAHRQSTLSKCDKIFRLSHDGLTTTY